MIAEMHLIEMVFGVLSVIQSIMRQIMLIENGTERMEFAQDVERTLFSAQRMCVQNVLHMHMKSESHTFLYIIVLFPHLDSSLFPQIYHPVSADILIFLPNKCIGFTDKIIIYFIQLFKHQNLSRL